MEKAGSKPVYARRRHSEMESLLKAFENSPGLSVKEFCRKHHIGEGSFYNFRKRFRQKEAQSNSARFIALEPSVAGERAAERLFAEVKGIKIYQPVTAEYLKVLCL